MSRLPSLQIDLANIQDAPQLHGLLRDALGFPHWYGCNWDAFWDAISALVEMPEQLIFEHWPGFAERLPREARMIQECLERLRQLYPEQACQGVVEGDKGHSGDLLPCWGKGCEIGRAHV